MTGNFALPAQMAPTRFISIPLVGQATFYTCGVAVLQSILFYNGIESRQDIIELAVGSSPSYGTGIKNMCQFLNDKGLKSDLAEDLTLHDLKGHIDLGRVVVCLIQAWNDEPGHDYADTWCDGHYVTAVGYDDERFYFMDPYNIANYAYVENDDFLRRWHGINLGVKYINAGIVVTNPSPAYRPGVFTRMP
ncbi:MAG: C39 family peptidase [Synergistaceae bacterium]|jgi:ABC-type bacteriocin/lantibiotic exporter with double-glycine peptidase domain|nr:C39 family peptidase [Synergistaceae bacterium]